MFRIKDVVIDLAIGGDGTRSALVIIGIDVNRANHALASVAGVVKGVVVKSDAAEAFGPSSDLEGRCIYIIGHAATGIVEAR